MVKNNNQSFNIVFAGTPEFSVPCLDALVASHHRISAVYTQPDRPAGRGRQLTPSAVKMRAEYHQLPIYQPLNFKTTESIAQLEQLQPDVMIVIAYGLILPQVVLDIPKLGCINVHASLLPRWRGASPIQQAILHDDPVTGITIMQMDAGMDTGAMLYQVPCPIQQSDTSATLHNRLAQLACAPLLQILEALTKGLLQATPQDSSKATYAPKIKKEEALIDWNNTAQQIDCLIRAFNPWPIAYTKLHDATIRIHQAQVSTLSTKGLPGTIAAFHEDGMLVSTGVGTLCVQRIQLPGGKIISVSEARNSARSPIQLNAVFS